MAIRTSRGPQNEARARRDLQRKIKHIETITGTGAAVNFDITHNLNTQDVILSIYRVSTLLEVAVTVKHTDQNTVRVTFGAAPALGVAYNVTVIG